MKRIKKEKIIQELSFYTALPCENINYEAFKALAKERLHVLRKIENNIKDASTIKATPDDSTSHACLKLICAQTKKSSIWFINLETQLFKCRLERNEFGCKQFFIEKFWPHLNIKNHKIDHLTKFDLQNINSINYDSEIRIHFSKCSDILAKRASRMEEGYFVMSDEIMVSFLVSEFRRYITARMDMLSINDERIKKLGEVFFVEAAPVGPEYKNLLKKSNLFPLCIKGILGRLNVNKHLKYNDRQALCLFLKDAGFPLNDTIQFFRSNFKCTIEQFNKEYLYAIRHNYGLEGKRAQYGCFSCSKLMGLASDPNSFGCPFVKNIDFVKANCDLEDLCGGAIKSCSRVAEGLIGGELERVFTTPVEYLKLVDKEDGK